MRIRGTTCPEVVGVKIIMYLKFQIPSSLLTVQLSLAYYDDQGSFTLEHCCC